MNRIEMANHIVARLEEEKDALESMYATSKPAIGHFVIDDLLPVDIARRIFDCFPLAKSMRLRKSLREFKYSAAQMNVYDPILEEAIYAFQDARVVEIISAICGIRSLYPDEHLYAGGISLMGDRHFLNPHLDNSHDKDRSRWRVLNLLYYVTRTGRWIRVEIWNSGLKAWPDHRLQFTANLIDWP